MIVSNTINKPLKAVAAARGVKEIYGCDFPVILAPMAGITDLPFRLLCREQGADVVVTEMISAKALYYGNRNTVPLMRDRKSVV